MVAPEVRARGIFELILYRATLRVSGTFAPDLSAWKIAPEDGLWDEAALSVGIPVSPVPDATDRTLSCPEHEPAERDDDPESKDPSDGRGRRRTRRALCT